MTGNLSQDVTDCPDCGRRTPAARGSCMYCGTALPVSSIQTAPRQRALESFERAFNTVLDPAHSRLDDRSETLLAQALNIEQAEAHAFISAGKRLPLARSQTRQEAELIAALIRTCGLGASVVADEDLKVGLELIRARRIERTAEELTVHYAGGAMAVPRSEIRVLVVGMLRNTRVDYIESRAGMRGQGPAVVDTSEFRSDETLLDVYATTFDKSFRIRSDAFDYSGLVWPLSFQAETNFQSAIASLHGAIPHATVEDDFARIRGLLSRAWPERSRVEARGVRRAGVSHRPVAQSSLVSDNRDQFERYSRLVFLSMVAA
jgi:hypothetical protein